MILYRASRRAEKGAIGSSDNWRRRRIGDRENSE